MLLTVACHVLDRSTAHKLHIKYHTLHVICLVMFWIKISMLCMLVGFALFFLVNKFLAGQTDKKESRNISATLEEKRPEY